MPTHGHHPLIYELHGLPRAADVLHIGTHPDDEEPGLMTYMARKYGVRIVYWSATRGESGQNRVGSHSDEALGVYRTWETEAARRLDGGEALFGPFYDFGFSKTGEEALTKWGRADVVREIVRAIRLVQPAILVACWQGTARDGHGQHMAIGMATIEAFEAAGDAEQFCDLRSQCPPAWQPRKLYQATSGDWQPGEDTIMGARQPQFEQSGYLCLNTGEYDPIAETTFQEQAWLAYNSHQTQAMAFVPERGDFYTYYRLYKSLVEVPMQESSFYCGLDPMLTGLADYPGAEVPGLREALGQIQGVALEALRRYRVELPMPAGEALLEGVRLLQRLREELTQGTCDHAVQALATYLERKQRAFEEVAARCLGLQLEGWLDRARVTPGERFRLKAQLWNHHRTAIQGVHFESRFRLSPRQRFHTTAQGETSTLVSATFEMAVPASADMSCPYWLVQPQTPYRYAWPEGEPCTQPFGPPLADVSCSLLVHGQRLWLHAPTQYREGYPSGYRGLSLAVVPPISLHPQRRQEFLAARVTEQRFDSPVVVRNSRAEGSVEGMLRVEAPDGWQVEPSHVPIALQAPGDTTTIRLTVMVPGYTPPGRYQLRHIIHCDGRDYDVVLEAVRMAAPGLQQEPDEQSCAREELIVTPATVQVDVIAVQFLPGLTYGYIRGATDEILGTLHHFDVDIHDFSDDDISYTDLETYDAIIVGPNAYLTRDVVRKNAQRLLHYVAQGGTLIVQYQSYGYQDLAATPYPFRYHQPHDRVTYEDAPVTCLQPEHCLFHLPNTITAADFDHWLIERGLYFFGQWDQHFDSLLTCNDPGEAPKPGGMLIASYGQGTYLYTGYAFFRQLPAGVHGAFRLFANLLGLPGARIRERMALLQPVELFACLLEEELYALARLVSERRLEDGEYLCHAGEEGDELYLIVRGKIGGVVASDARPPQRFTRAAGDVVGEFAALSNIPRSATLRADGPVHVLVVKGSHFRALLAQHPTMSRRVIELLVRKLIAT